MVKNPPANVGDADSVPGLGRSSGEGNGKSLQYSCLGNPTDRGACWATAHGVAKGWTQLSDKAYTHVMKIQRRTNRTGLKGNGHN